MTSTDRSFRAVVSDDLVVFAVPDIRQQPGLAAVCGGRQDMLAASRAAATAAPTVGRAGTTGGLRPPLHRPVGSSSAGLVRREES